MTTAAAEALPDTDQQKGVPAEESQVGAQHVQGTKPQGITDETWQSLTAKAKLYVAEYVQHGNVLKAYRNAGYTRGKQEADTERHKAAAYQIRKGKYVRQALVEHADHRANLAQAKQDYALDWIVAELDRLKEKSEENPDSAAHLAVAVRCVELIGKTRGVFVDTTVVDVAARREYSEQERIETLRLSRYLSEHDDEVLVEDAHASGHRPNGNDGEGAPQGGKSAKTPDSAIGESPIKAIGEIPDKNGKS